ncbi:MAG: restriction endonuclease subunit S [Flavobacteriales bacterium]|nr:restriction endonuclease subunit S [Flavobacteriales bacterium]MBP6698836.1 restriction endonuclease subunit S [Flavobacteriales bacterium]
MADADGMVSGAYVVLKPKPTIHSPFAIDLFNRARSIYDFNAYSYGLTSDRLRLYYQDFARIPFHIPTLPEQTKIAGFLSAVDGKIQQLTRKKALLEQYKKGVMQQLFTQEIRFTRADGTPSRGASATKGKAFPDWEERRLGEICTDISYGMNAAAVEYDGENKYLRITDIDESSHEFLQTGLTSPGNVLEDKYVLREGDLLFARTGASVGKSYLYKKKDGKVYFAGFLIRFHVKEGVPEFIYAQTLTTEYGRWVTENSMRSGQPGLNAEEYKSFTIHFPCLEEQQRIAGFLSALDGRVAAVGQQLERAVQWKRGLLQQMFV